MRWVIPAALLLIVACGGEASNEAPQTATAPTTTAAPTPSWTPLPPRAFRVPHLAQDAFVFDEAGVVLAKYEWGTAYNPTTISQMAIVDYAQQDFDRFRAQLSWLTENVRYRQPGGAAVWEYLFPYEPYQMTVPWISGLAQGNMLVVLWEAYGLTGDAQYRQMAEATLLSFQLPVDEGGVAHPSGWFEEYARPGGPETHVLNGHLYAVQGLQYYYEQTGDERAKRLYERGLAVAKAALPVLDLGDCVAYDGSRSGPGPIYATGVVVDQLWHFFETTGDYELYNYALRWAAGC